MASGLTITMWRVGEQYCILELQNKRKEKDMNKKRLYPVLEPECTGV